MAFRLPGAPMHDTSSKHGTNANYKKSGAPGLLGKILDPLGLKNKLMGGGKNCPPAQGAQQAAAAPAPDAPAQPAAPAPAAAAAPDPAAAAAPMKKGLKNGAPKLEDKDENKNKNYSKGAQNLLKAVPNREAYNKLSDADKRGFDKTAKRAGLPTMKTK